MPRCLGLPGLLDQVVTRHLVDWPGMASMDFSPLCRPRQNSGRIKSLADRARLADHAAQRAVLAHSSRAIVGKEHVTSWSGV
jgi:hypothetical protein